MMVTHKGGIDREEILEDNRWLMEQLEKVVKENTVLRRMVGQSGSK